MRGLQRLTYARFAELLQERHAVSSESASAVLASSEANGIPFPEAIAREGLVSEWDLVALAGDEFNLPVLPLHVYEADRDAVACLPADFELRHLLVPLDRMRGVLTVAMPVLTPFDVLEQARERTGLEIVPLVGFPSENRKYLETHVKPARRPQAWEKMFDEADRSVLQTKPAPASPPAK